MSIAAGYEFTAMVTEEGKLWVVGDGDRGSLGTAQTGLHTMPTRVHVSMECGRFVREEAVSMVASSAMHVMCVTRKGALYAWGCNESGQLGYTLPDAVYRPELVARHIHGDSDVVMVTCGFQHSIVLTAAARVFTCGRGSSGQLGHGSQQNERSLTCLSMELFGTSRIGMVACGSRHSVALAVCGGLYMWGNNSRGELGTDDRDMRLVPTKLADGSCSDEQGVFVAAGGSNTIVVTVQGGLWACGNGLRGRLGLDTTEDRLVLTRVGGGGGADGGGVGLVFGGGDVLMASCGYRHTLVVTKKGSVWAYGEGLFGGLGQEDFKYRTTPAPVDRVYFDHQCIVCVHTGPRHSVAVTENGKLYMWGDRKAIGQNRHPPTRQLATPVLTSFFQDARVGEYHNIPLSHALAFAMKTHARLGKRGCAVARKSRRQKGKTPGRSEYQVGFFDIPSELVKLIIAACVSCPQRVPRGSTGIIRLMGGGMIEHGDAS